MTCCFLYSRADENITWTTVISTTVADDPHFAPWCWTNKDLTKDGIQTLIMNPHLGFNTLKLAYLEYMSCKGVHGQHIELAQISKMHNRPIIIFQVCSIV